MSSSRVIIGIDPSYTRTGIVEYQSADNFVCTSVSPPSKEKVVRITEAFDRADEIACHVKTLLDKYKGYQIILAVEYPILSTRLGSYLAVITSRLDGLFRQYPVTVYYLPSQACNSIAHYNSKTELVNFVKKDTFVNGFKGNHDEATAVVLARIADMVMRNTYKNSYMKKIYNPR